MNKKNVIVKGKSPRHGLSSAENLNVMFTGGGGATSRTINQPKITNLACSLIYGPRRPFYYKLFTRGSTKSYSSWQASTTQH